MIRLISNLICILLGLSSFIYLIYSSWLVIDNGVWNSSDRLLLIGCGIVLANLFRIKDE